MTETPKPLYRDGVAITGVLALVVTLAVLTSGMGPDVTLHLFRMGGAAGGILAVGTMLTMSAIGFAAIAALMLRGVVVCCDVAIAIVERGRNPV